MGWLLFPVVSRVCMSRTYVDAYVYTYVRESWRECVVCLYILLQFGVICSQTANFLNRLISYMYSNRNSSGVQLILLCSFWLISGFSIM